MNSERATERKVHGVFGGGRFHWVGDGFRVSNYFPSGNDLYDLTSPFFLMDYHAPHTYAPTDKPRGVGSHPHRGFETVTLAFEGSVAHHDSAGNAGIIGPGDVQWMTAASGILHKEYHEAEFSRRGGTMHMMQLWVNLPARDKMSPPRYQELTAARMGKVELPGGGVVRVVAGEHAGVKGPAKTFTPIDLWEVRLPPGGHLDASFPAEKNVSLLVMDGAITVNGRTHVATRELLVFAREGEDIHVESEGEAHLLVLAGEPIHEPVVSYGPFVMNTEREIRQAIEDFNAGKLGQLD